MEEFLFELLNHTMIVPATAKNKSTTIKFLHAVIANHSRIVIETHEAASHSHFDSFILIVRE